ncbi:hypothetical protein MHLP_00760 [Candidatus Mycoplasma haematolamae str. Purdue]|uniref:Uncharacterized protein n=1 Tax=Mycoplasma haematolamae (strain Purdue) TaxID=1212765 RepID=I7C5E9_MYCHA|nr:DUF2613 domain-containing protein [Candidatus Mycoplasma haematolamae]AFO51732.1 hypothetical protein MHLP_00760 [Candidatus Mycoplasma haematolamae str. Purdue]
MSNLISVVSALSVAVGTTVGGGIFASQSTIPPTHNKDSRDSKSLGAKKELAGNQVYAKDSRGQNSRAVDLPSWFKGQHLSRLGTQTATLRKVTDGGWSASVHYLFNQLEGIFDYHVNPENVENNDIVGVVNWGSCISVSFKGREGSSSPHLILEGVSDQDLKELPFCGYQWYLKTVNPEHNDSEIAKWNKLSEGIHPSHWKDSDQLKNQKFSDWDSFNTEDNKMLDKCKQGKPSRCVVYRSDVLIPLRNENKQTFSEQQWQKQAQATAKGEWFKLTKDLPKKTQPS